MTGPQLREKLWEARLALRDILSKTDGEVPQWILTRRNVHEALERINEACKHAYGPNETPVVRKRLRGD